MKAGIAVDNWKLPVFRQQLTAAGFSYSDGGSITADTTLLTVETSDLLKLKNVIEACQRAACLLSNGHNSK